LVVAEFKGDQKPLNRIDDAEALLSNLKKLLSTALSLS
jgi:hypothetical protein